MYACWLAPQHTTLHEHSLCRTHHTVPILHAAIIAHCDARSAPTLYAIAAQFHSELGRSHIGSCNYFEHLSYLQLFYTLNAEACNTPNQPISTQNKWILLEKHIVQFKFCATVSM